jgi:Holliday junction DNA helicase RuvA
MFSYLKGTLVGVQKIANGRVILTVEVNNIGYDLQIPPRMMQQLPAIGQSIQVFTHLQVREDQWILYGFASLAERDLYRQLISVSGIGSQLAIALLDTLGITELVQAIVTGNTKVLIQTPGVGKKTAERIALELKTKLAEWHQRSGLSTTATPGLNPALQEDIEMTLLALGYTPSEVMATLTSLSQNTDLSADTDADEWIRQAIALLSQ